jgi:hypothetical protein
LLLSYSGPVSNLNVSLHHLLYRGTSLFLPTEIVYLPTTCLLRKVEPPFYTPVLFHFTDVLYFAALQHEVSSCFLIETLLRAVLYKAALADMPNPHIHISIMDSIIARLHALTIANLATTPPPAASIQAVEQALNQLILNDTNLPPPPSSPSPTPPNISATTSIPKSTPTPVPSDHPHPLPAEALPIGNEYVDELIASSNTTVAETQPKRRIVGMMV